MEEKKVSWLELFFDLIFVTAVSYTTHLFIDIEQHPKEIVFYAGEYLLMVFPMFWLWTGQTMLFNRYSQNIPKPELFMLPQMFFFILITASLDFQFAHTYHSYLTGYLGVRVLTVLQYYIVAKRAGEKRKEVAGLLLRLFLPGVIIPFFSLFFEEHSRYVVMYAGIAADMILPLFFKRSLIKAPVNLPHLAERFGLFTLITFGEALVATTGMLVGHTGDYHTLLFSALSFSLIALLWGSYFYGYEQLMDHHLETNGQVLLYGHFFILVSVMVLAGGIELLHTAELPHNVLMVLLFGPLILFLAIKHLVFYHHRKRAVAYYRREVMFIVAALGLVPALNLIVDLSITLNLILAIVLCGLEAFLQSGKHKRMSAGR